MGILYVVATPIGNLDDLSSRAINILKEVELILAEDTRVTSKLLAKLDIKKPIESYHQHSTEAKKRRILEMLQAGSNIALVSDAGTPGISDPGNELVDYLYFSGLVASESFEGFAARIPASTKPSKIKIIPIPGPSAAITALSVCGLNVSKYIFIGFMPKKKQSRLFKQLKEANLPFVYYDSPYRVIKNLMKVKEALGERRVFVARELTKVHEELYRGEISKVIHNLQNSTLKGEITVVVEKA